MGSHGHARTRFLRALAGDNELLVEATSAELRPLGLADALAYTLWQADHGQRFRPAMNRWHRAWEQETQPRDPRLSSFVRAALELLPTRHQGPALAALASVARQQHLLEVVAVVEQRMHRLAEQAA